MKRIVTGIVAHVDAGKTTLSEALLYATGTTRKLGRVDHCDAFLDTDAIERARGIPIYTAPAALRVGDVADLIALDLNLPNMQPLHNPVSQVVYAATGHEVFLTMVGGESLYHKGAFTRFDYPALLEEMQGIARWARKRMT